jgi:hypothetical protein
MNQVARNHQSRNTIIVDSASELGRSVGVMPNSGMTVDRARQIPDPQDRPMGNEDAVRWARSEHESRRFYSTLRLPASGADEAEEADKGKFGPELLDRGSSSLTAGRQCESHRNYYLDLILCVLDHRSASIPTVQCIHSWNNPPPT